ncbi:uncharacterized protein BDV14DRAFT_119491 [Aspergillus stella-maris]|uniref:uncharacterized protein n=1 Tax=Aspergillus stella-maris TaxID=1810926 RepID=UPI003CCE398D
MKHLRSWRAQPRTVRFDSSSQLQLPWLDLFFLLCCTESRCHSYSILRVFLGFCKRNADQRCNEPVVRPALLVYCLAPRPASHGWPVQGSASFRCQLAEDFRVHFFGFNQLCSGTNLATPFRVTLELDPHGVPQPPTLDSMERNLELHDNHMASTP